MKKVLSFVWAVPAVALLVSCKKVVGEGPVINETRHPGNFTGIISTVGQNVQVVQDSVYFVELKAQQNILDVVETFTSGGNLNVKIKRGFFVGKSQDVTIIVHTPVLNYLEQDGSGNILVKGTVTTNNISCDISGSGSIQLETLLVQNTLRGEINGSGDIIIQSGTAQQVNYVCNGSGDITSAGLVAQFVNTETNGSGTMRVRAEKKLTAHISGSGNVYYAGSPSVYVSISGSGKVKPI